MEIVIYTTRRKATSPRRKKSDCTYDNLSCISVHKTGEVLPYISDRCVPRRYFNKPYLDPEEWYGIVKMEEQYFKHGGDSQIIEHLILFTS